ncbi:MAG TPA: protein kinase [Acidobacteriota bacterium]|nr:protein kinase [Acidobacteriota bacterium]
MKLTNRFPFACLAGSEEALDREPGRREAFLEEACAGDEDLRQKVITLLTAHDKAGSFGETPALELAARAMAEQAVRSLVGKRLGPYEILSLIGRGGMGEVYRVRDTRLDRIEALKILPTEVAADTERIRRFVREAHAASALNHPNIATIYEIGESDGVRWIAMELVEGETLAERLTERPLAVEEILDIGIQTTESLEAAHRKGIIHRDIKPANLMITSEGRVKVLDFGLAKIKRTGGPAAAATVSSETHTIPGIVMGTARYMSPEQILGQSVDHRTDVFSAGAVLYQLAVGQPPFAGKSSSAIFDSILHQTPAWPPHACATIPEELRRIIHKSLEKFREMRYQSAADLCADLKHLKHDLERERLIAQPPNIAGPTQPDQKAVPKRTARILALARILGIVILGAIVIWSLKSRLASTPETQLTAIPLTSYPGSEMGASFSPDGNQVAFAWNGEEEDNWDIYVTLIGSNQHLRLTTNPARDTWPAWSPDGRQIAFCRDLGPGKRAVILISPLGGPERTLTEVAHVSEVGEFLFGPFLSWSPDGRALATVDSLDPHTNPGLALYMMETGEKHILTKPTVIDSCPAFSPDGRTLAFCRWVAW